MGAFCYHFNRFTFKYLIGQVLLRRGPKGEVDHKMMVG